MGDLLPTQLLSARNNFPLSVAQERDQVREVSGVLRVQPGHQRQQLDQRFRSPCRKPSEHIIDILTDKILDIISNWSKKWQSFKPTPALLLPPCEPAVSFAISPLTPLKCVLNWPSFSYF